jgi:large subunit ribosomal protein L4
MTTAMKTLYHSFRTGNFLGSLPFFFYTKPRQDIIYRCLQYEKSWFKQSTESTKQLGQVRGSTRKPFPQKGRGKARVGTIRSPQFRGGR